jgi:hypothetical protein
LIRAQATARAPDRPWSQGPIEPTEPQVAESRKNWSQHLRSLAAGALILLHAHRVAAARPHL